jgi:peroxiredoxin family protein
MAEERLSLIVFTGDVDRLLPVGILASGAVAAGQEVDIFLTMWGLLAFRKGAWQGLPLSPAAEALAPGLKATLAEKRIPDLPAQLRQAKAIGDVHVHACGMSMDLFGLTLADLEDVVDDVAGVYEFIDHAKEGKMTLFV